MVISVPLTVVGMTLLTWLAEGPLLHAPSRSGTEVAKGGKLVSLDAIVGIEEKLDIPELVGEAKVRLATVVLPRLTTPLREYNDAETVE